MNKRIGLPAEREKTMTRRTLLDWMGRAAVLSLGADFLHGCGTEDGTDSQGNRIPPSGSEPTCGDEAEFAFRPGEGDSEVFREWGERTVDDQNLMDILEHWELQVNGLVRNPRVFSFADLLQLERHDQTTDFHCVEGWSIYDVPWNGIHLSTLFDIVEPEAGATHVTFHTQGDAYNESLPIEVALEPKTMLAFGIDCSTIPLKHGFPLRVVVPRMFGYKSAKYVYRIELDYKEVWGFWVQFGYPYDAPVPEGRLRPGKY
jgi:hypothetical protein